MANKSNGAARERLILAGIQEIERSGVNDFSMRRVAANCGVSPTAPFKHFADRQAFIEAIISYVYEQWDEKRKIIIAESGNDLRSQLTNVSLGYIRFLHENPHFRSLIMVRDVPLETEGRHMLLHLTNGSREMIDQFCRDTGMPPEEKNRKTFLVLSLIYGAALMLDNGELPNEESALDMARSLIEREFEIP